MFSTHANSQIKWYNPQETSFYCIQNQGWNEDGGNYNRLPNRAKDKVRKQVWNLACQSSGLSVRFYSDAQIIKVRYKVTGGYSMPHMPSTGVSGVDLYRKSDDGSRICYGSYSFGDTIRFDYKITNKQTKGKKSEFELFLPLYNGVKWLEIGVDEDSHFSFIPTEKKKPIVIYGTSIAQGACASRPAMAWGNILNREMGMPVVNLGFSGNGKLEPEVIDFLNEVDASVYIIDCMPNLNKLTSEEVKELVYNAVMKIREKNKTPILLVEHAGYSNSYTDKEWDEAFREPNKGQRSAFELLEKENIPDLYYLTNKELNYHPDSWVDYVHPSDWGMMRQAEVIIDKLKPILNYENTLY